MTNREKLHLAVATVGLKVTLEEIIKMLEKHPDEEFLVTLKNDIQTALNHYNDRYKDG